MSEQNPKTATAAPAHSASPEAECSARIKEIQARIVALQSEIRMIQGRYANRDPALARTLAKENELHHARLVLLQKALFGLMMDSYKPRQAQEEQQQYEILRRSTVEYCKKANVDPEIWKNLES